MKGWIRRVVGVVLLPVLLTATNGIVVLVHTCLSSDSVEVTLFQRSGCCSDQPCSPDEEVPHQESPSFEGQCCILKSDYVKVHLCQPSVHCAFDFSSCCQIPDHFSDDACHVAALADSPVFPDDASPPERASSPDYIFSVHQLLI